MSWHEYHMGFARHAATKSKDSTQVGAVLVGPDGRSVLLAAYNGPPAGVEDRPDRFVRPAKYLYASHAEANLIAFAARRGIRTEGCSVYVTHAPCAACARSLIQAGIQCVVAGDGTTSMPAEEFEAAGEMLREARVRFVRYVSAPSQLPRQGSAPAPQPFTRLHEPQTLRPGERYDASSQLPRQGSAPAALGIPTTGGEG